MRLILFGVCVIMYDESVCKMGVVSMHERVLGANLPSVAALAYLGDAAHSLYVRRMLVARGISKSGELNRLALSYVTCEEQAKAARIIEEYLLDDEREVFRRAQNSAHLNKPKRAKIADYRAATALEAVLGMLTWLEDGERISYLLAIAYEGSHTEPDGE